MTRSTEVHGHGKTPRSRRQPIVITGAVAVGIAWLMIALASPWGVGVFERLGAGGTPGLYTLNETGSTGGSFSPLNARL